MPAWLIPIIWGVITALLNSVISRVVTALGIGSVSFMGANFLLNKVKSAFSSVVSGMGADALNFLGMSGVGVGISIIFSAFVIRMTLDGVDKAGNFAVTKFSGFGGGK